MASASVEKSKHHSLHFFRPVVRPLNEGIPLPMAFVQRYGDSLKEVAVLKVPTGAEWRVKLQRRVHSREIWLQGKGLTEFGEFYSINLYHLLLFKYEGQSRFNVLIFDTMTFEIDYPLVPVHIKLEEIIDEDGGNQSDSAIKMSENRGKKKREYCLTVNGRRLRQRPEMDDKCRGAPEGPVRSSVRPSNHLKKENTPDDQYPSFDFVVNRSNVSQPLSCLGIPAAFWKKNLDGITRDEFKIGVPENGKTWPVVLCISGRRARMRGSGWNRFVHENGLSVGEACTFELVKARKLFNFYRKRN